MRLEFLPPYSPDFNPIEEGFSAMKAQLRRDRDYVVRPGVARIVASASTCLSPPCRPGRNRVMAQVAHGDRSGYKDPTPMPDLQRSHRP